MHLRGHGDIASLDCGVHFDLYIPCVWERFPYMLLIARGSHTHFPPPQTKLPKAIREEVMSVIQKHDASTLTTRK
jgi:hypothetical protein